ncbi:glycolate oxidase iron-sulfur subunit [Thiocapsa imhoffii]|uniref:Glycolate oxidase iron-sulfur subunit n=1 Tax=Thiocapsa imhoffii TaxID=382777 RepID=A0A9X0WF11_9GAMM|nr:glycolate oxidase subunit GlcF [Thiocapsa imhoffii]MBK1643388.1 glycolate oxidase iron-sulfur subunit [Thiocapsa imhoffii]
MQTEILPEFLSQPSGREAETILRSCVHCGFCTATCPTYQLLGDELDGPRGRIYQIKLVLEGQQPTRITQRHLDRCLSCRACETTCPSGVRYARLLDIGRHLVDERVTRGGMERLMRWALVRLLPYPKRFGPLLQIARWTGPLLPKRLRKKLPAPQPVGPLPPTVGRRRMLVLGGCVQRVATPRTNAVAARVLARLGFDLVDVPHAGCCGAVAYHLGAEDEGRAAMRRNIDAWWPEIESGCEAILVNASGCGVMIKEYGQALAEDSQYAERANRIANLARDPIEVLQDADLSPLGLPGRGRRVAFHAPCTLQHGQQLRTVVEPLLTRLGFQLTSVPDAHLCCGSAGTYSITQPALSRQLLENKVSALESGTPEIIATANIGCQLHLGSGTSTPVVHWLELLEAA